MSNVAILFTSAAGVDSDGAENDSEIMNNESLPDSEKTENDSKDLLDNEKESKNDRTHKKERTHELKDRNSHKPHKKANPQLREKERKDHNKQVTKYDLEYKQDIYDRDLDIIENKRNNDQYPIEYILPLIPNQNGLIDLPFSFGPQNLPAMLGVEINGSITSQTWTEANSPYYITENLTIPFGETLYIEPGVNVIFNGSYNIWVEGNLWANGTNIKIINFTNITTSSPGDWGAIQFNNTANGRISYTNISYATNAVILNSTSAVIEIDNSIIFGSSSYGILAYAGRFNIHDNTFVTLDYAVHIDIFYVNSGSFNTGDMLINDNYVLGVSGIQVQQINFQDPLPDSDIVVGQLQIINNTINDMANTAISIENYIVTNMLGGNLTWDEIIITDNNITASADDAIFINNDRLYNITNVNVTIGGFNISGNNITSINNRGIYQDWGYMEELYGTTDISIGQTVINNNIIFADEIGIYLNWQNYGYYMFDLSTVSLAETIISQNNIDSFDEGILFEIQTMAYGMNNDTAFFLGDIIVNDNTVDSGFEAGIYIYFQELGYEMYDFAMLIMGDVIVNNNNVTSNREGIYYYANDCAAYMYNNSMAYIGATEFINNTIDGMGGAAEWGMEVYSEQMGYQTHDNAFVTFGTWDILWNNITSEWGMRTGPEYDGYEMFDNSELIFYDWNIMYNTIDTTVRGLRFDYYDCGEELYGNSSVTIGNATVMYNNVTAQGSYGYYLYYDYIGYEMHDNSTVSVGWLDISYNNFNSSGGEGMYLDIYYLGAYMSHNSSADIGDMIFTNNEVWSTNNNGIFFYEFYENAYYNEDNSSVIIGDVLVINNNVTSGLDGIYVDTWTENGYNIEDNATVIFGNFEFNNNTIDSGDAGIYLNQVENWGDYLYGNSEVTFGYFQINDNDILAGDDGIHFSIFDYIGYEMYGYSEFTIGNLEICNNTINASQSGIYKGNFEYLGYNLNDNCTLTFFDFMFNDNYIIATGNYGIFCDFLGSGAYNMEEFSDVTFGNFQWNNNNISGPPSDGLYLNNFYYFGYNLRDNAMVDIGTFDFSDNWISTSGSGIYFSSLGNFGASMYDNSSYLIGDWLINDNTVWSEFQALYFEPYQFGYNMYENSKATYGTNEISGNYLNSTDSEGLYAYWWYQFAYEIYENSSITVGDSLIINNNISAYGSTQAIETGPYETAYYVYDNASAFFGNYNVSDNTVYCNNDRGMYLYYYYVGSYLEPNNYPACASTVVVGDFMVNDNTITSISSDGMYLDFEYSGYSLYGDASVTLGSVELYRNTIHAENGYGIYFSTAEYFGYEMYDDSSFIMGDWLMNDNTVWSNDASIYHETEYFGYEMYDNATATIGANEITGNYCNSTSGYGIYAWWWYDFGSNIYENTTVTVGDCIIDNNNIITNSTWGYGIYTGPYNAGSYVYDNSSATFGDYIIINNQVRTNNSEGMYIYYYEMGYYLEPNQYNTCAGSVVVGDFILNNNEVNSLNNDGVSLEFYENGYNIYNDSYVTLGNVEICNNTINSLTDSGLYFSNCYDFGTYMYDNASFSMGDWLINDNTVWANDHAFYTDAYGFGYEMYDDSVATFGTFELLRNYLNATNNYGLGCYWWYESGYNLYENAKVSMGDCIIKNNNVSSQNSDAIYTGPQYAGQSVYDNASAIFGDYVVSDNTVFSRTDVGIYFNYRFIGFTMEPNQYSTCTAYVEVGDMRINNNDVISPNHDGIYFEGNEVGSWLYENATVLTGNTQVNDNTVHSNGFPIILENYNFGYNQYDNSSVTHGNVEINNNDLNSTGDNGIELYIQTCFNDMNDISTFSRGDFFVNGNTIRNSSEGIRYLLADCGLLADNASVDIGSLEINGNVINAEYYAILYETHNTPLSSPINTTQSYGNVIISNNDLVGGDGGINLHWFDPDYNIEQPTFFLLNNDIHDGLIDSEGIYLYNIFNSYLEDITIDNFAYGVYVNNSNINHMLNSSISNIGILDFNLTSSSYIYTLNTTFNKASVVYEDNLSLLEVAWFMNVQVNYQTNDPAPFANLTVYDIDSTEIFNGKTDANGRANYLICMDYQENITGEIKNYNDYTALANDSGMFGMAIPDPTMDRTKLVIITLLDTINPVLINDSSDSFGTTGDLYHFNVNITDNLMMNFTRVVYWFGSDAPQNITMNGTGPYWLNITAPLNSIDQLHYYFSADDAFGNWLNTLQVDIPIYDNDAPYNIIDTSDSTAIMSKDYNFLVNAEDNIGVTEIHVVWWFDVGTSTNVTMDGTGPYNWTIPVPTSGVEILHYYFTVTDAAGNWFTGPTIYLDVGDNVPPKIRIDKPDNGTLVSGVIKIGITASDVNSGLAFVALKVLQEAEIYNSTPTTSSFEVNFNTTTLSDGEYIILAIAVDQRGMMNSTKITIIVDNTPPTVEVGPDENILVGETVDFDGSRCSDNSGIDNYNWSFTYNGKTQYLSGISPNFTFEIAGDYTVTLTVTDILGNFASDTMVVYVTKPVPPARPKVDKEDPINNTDNVNISIKVTITFDIPMNTTSVEAVFDITPEIGYTLSWNDDNTVLTIEFTEDLSYNTTYTITIGKAKATNGRILLDHPYKLNFITEKKPVLPPKNNEPKLTEGKITPNKGDTKTEFTFSVHYFDSDGEPPETIQVIIDGIPYDMTLASGTPENGFYEHKMKLSEGEHPFYFAANDGKDDGESDDGTPTSIPDAWSTPKVTKPEKKEEGADYTLFLIMLIIIIIIILLIVLMLRRKPEEEEEEQEVEEEEFGEEELGEEEEDLEEEIVDTEEFECPDCGAAVAAGDVICSDCGAEFEEDEDLEDEDSLMEEGEPIADEEEPITEEDEPIAEEEEPVEEDELEE